MGFDTAFARSKHRGEFAMAGAPELDFVLPVCDMAAVEVCPVWPGQSMTARWGVPDPVEAKGTAAERHLAFADSLRMLRRRIELFVNLLLQKIDRLALKNQLDEIGRT